MVNFTFTFIKMLSEYAALILRPPSSISVDILGSFEKAVPVVASHNLGTINRMVLISFMSGRFAV
jgi:hypothetical protein